MRSRILKFLLKLVNDYILVIFQCNPGPHITLYRPVSVVEQAGLTQTSLLNHRDWSVKCYLSYEGFYVKLGDNCIQNFHLGRYIVGYTVGVLRRRVSGYQTIYLSK